MIAVVILLIAATNAYLIPYPCTAMNNNQCTGCDGVYYRGSSAFFIILNKCYNCPYGCSSCSLQECLSCMPNFLQYNHTCLPYPSGCTNMSDSLECLECGSKYKLVDKECLMCTDQNCLLCSSDINICDKCIDYYHLEINGSCTPNSFLTNNYSPYCSKYSIENLACEECTSSTFLEGGICINCGDNCNKCSSLAQCSDCFPRYYLSNGACIQCSYGCLICLNLSKCIQCYNGLDLINGNCISNYYMYQQCPMQFCLECPNNVCTKCRYGYKLTLYSCISRQEIPCLSYVGTSLACKICRYPFISVNNKCIRCPLGCAECFQSNTCFICYKEYYMVDEVCYNCPNGCSSCLNATFCTGCQEYYTYHEGACLSCNDPSCLLCSENQSVCYSCLSQYILQYGKCINCVINNCKNCIIEGVCEECYDSFVIDKNLNECNFCGSNCQKCDIVDVCLQCFTGYFVENGVCLKCNSFLNNCSNCISSTQCTSCYFSNGILNGLCYSCSDPKCAYCPDINVCVKCYYGTFLLDNVCTDCDASCNSCIGPTKNHCLECKYNYYPLYNSTPFLTCTQLCSDYGLILYNSICFSKCPVGTYSDITYSYCYNCDTTCLTCYGERNKCMQCAKNTYPVYPIVDGTFSCIENCTIISYLLMIDKCVASCGDGWFPTANNTICEECFLHCQICVGSTISDCQQCSNNSYPYISIENGCYSNESEIYFIYQKRTYLEETVFKNCDQSCSHCLCNGSEECCIECAEGYYPIGNNACIDSCDAGLFKLKKYSLCSSSCLEYDGYYPDLITGECNECHISCKSCIGPSELDCITCASNRYLLVDSTDLTVKSCIDKCSSHYYSSNNEMSCNRCHDNCEECNGGGIHDCISCKKILNFILLDGACILNCTTNNNQTTCLNCLIPNCELCNKIECLRCKKGLKLCNSLCLNNCLEGYYETKNSLCIKCHSKCKQCFGPKSNQCKTCSVLEVIKNGECKPKVCRNGEWLELLTGKCELCDESCLTCRGPYSVNCIQCSYLRISHTLSNGSQACRLCSEISHQLIYDSTINNCLEICGDGINNGTYECDDGNKLNNDGCSSSCQIEKGWVCNTNAVNKIDVCSNKMPVILRRFRVQKGLKFIAQFSKKIKFSDLTSIQIEVIKENSDKQYLASNISLSSVNGFTKIIKGTFLLDYPVDKNDTFVLTFPNSITIYDEWLNSPTNTSLSYKSNFKQNSSYPGSSFSNSMQTTTVVSSLVTMIISLAFSLVFNTPIEGLWALVCAIQLISYLSMLDLDLPLNLKNFLEYMEKVHSFGAVIPNPLKKEWAAHLNNERFFERGFTSNYSLFLCGSDIEMIIVQILAAMIVSKLALKIKFLKKFESTVKYNMPLKTLVVGYVRIALALWINIFNIGDTKAKSVLFELSSTILVIGISVYPAMLSLFLSYRIDDIKADDDRIAHFKTILPVKHNILAINFYPIFLVKRLLFCVIIVALDRHVIAQVIFLLLLSAPFIYYMVKVKPIEDLVSQRGFIIAEFGWIASVLVIGVTGSKGWNAEYRMLMGWLSMGVVIGLIVACWTNFFVTVIPKIISKIKEKCKSKRQQSNTAK